VHIQVKNVHNLYLYNWGVKLLPFHQTVQISKRKEWKKTQTVLNKQHTDLHFRLQSKNIFTSGKCSCTCHYSIHGEGKYSFTRSYPWHQMEMGSQPHVPDALPPEKEP